MTLTEHEHDALGRLARRGTLALGNGPDEVPASAAIRFGLAGFATLTLCQDKSRQQVEITRQGRAFHNRTAT